MKFYKALLRFIQIFIVLVVLPRVAGFVFRLEGNPGLVHTLISWAFAASLGLGTVATAYFSNESEPPEYEDEPNNPKERKRREREAVFFATMLNAAPYARRAMWLFAFLDGLFNLAEAFLGAEAAGLFDVGRYGQGIVTINMTATAIFGIAPTVLNIVLARVMAMVDRIPEDYERPRSRQEVDFLRTALYNMGVKMVSTQDVVTTFGSSDRTLPEPEPRTVRSNGSANHRTEPNGQTEKIHAYLNASASADTLPTLREIWEAMPEPKPAKSTISVARSQWLEQHSRQPEGE